MTKTPHEISDGEDHELIERLQRSKHVYKCAECKDTGYVGDLGPGIRGNNEYIPCECRKSDAPNAYDLLRTEGAAKERAEILEMIEDEIDLANINWGHDTVRGMRIVYDKIQQRNEGRRK